jgi:hypothetical protein
MSDDVKVSDETKPVTDAPVNSSTPKNYSEEEFKKVIAERDKAKEKLRKIEEDEKKAQEQKAIEEGRIKEVLSATEAKLATAEQKAKAYEEMQKDLRDKALSNIKDAEMRSAAEDITDLKKLIAFSEKVSKTKIEPYNAKSASTAGEPKQYKTSRDWENDLRDRGLA